MKAAFFPGCLIPIKYPQMEMAIRRTLPPLGVEIVDVEGFSCCPDPIYFQASDKVSWLAMAARNLCIAEEAGIDIFTICSGCTGTLSEANHMLKTDPALRDMANARLAKIGKEYKGTVEIRHIVTMLRDQVGIDKIRESVTRPLTDVRIAMHYGCHLLKPSNIMRIDDPDEPQILHQMIDAIGAVPVTHDECFLCCGKSCVDPDLPLEMTATVLRSIKKADVDCMGMVCPTCFSSFDTGQVLISRKTGEEFGVPPVYYFQLLGLAQGLTPDEVGLTRHRMKPVGVFEKIGVV
jgi:heterodisulfide reductase subunit B2